MRFEGYWHLGEAGILSPILNASALDPDGNERDFKLLLDTGADRTVFAAELLPYFEFNPEECSLFHLEGVGGGAESIVFDGKIFFVRQDGLKVPINGRFAIFTDPNALELSVLGRDILNYFSVIVDRPGDVVCLLAGNHCYIIQES